MIFWRYELLVTSAEIEFAMTDDFNPAPLGADWLRLATEWYQQGLIPRSSWLRLLKQNEMLESEYNDERGQEEITEDLELIMQKQNEQYSKQLKAQQEIQAVQQKAKENSNG